METRSKGKWKPLSVWICIMALTISRPEIMFDLAEGVDQQIFLREPPDQTVVQVCSLTTII